MYTVSFPILASEKSTQIYESLLYPLLKQGCIDTDLTVPLLFAEKVNILTSLLVCALPGHNCQKQRFIRMCLACQDDNCHVQIQLSPVNNPIFAIFQHAIRTFVICFDSIMHLVFVFISQISIL